MTDEEWEEFKEQEFQRHAPMAADFAYIAFTIGQIVQKVIENREAKEKSTTRTTSA